MMGVVWIPTNFIQDRFMILIVPFSKIHPKMYLVL